MSASPPATALRFEHAHPPTRIVVGPGEAGGLAGSSTTSASSGR